MARRRASARSTERRSKIATFNEGPLHAALKAHYLEPGDRAEVPVDGRQIDVVRDELLIEIQTGSFGALKRKLAGLVPKHRVLLVYPVPVEKWIVRLDEGGEVLGRRKSPKRGRLENAFAELVSLPKLLLEPNFMLEIVLTQEEEVRRHEPGRVWRRKGWVIVERRLLDVIGRYRVRTATDLLQFLPEEIPLPFTTADLALHLGIARDLAQKMAYCLRESGAIHAQGRRKAGLVYDLRPPSAEA